MQKTNKGISIAKDAAVLTAAKCITLLISLVTSMLLSRFRTLDEYGTYSQIQTVITLAVSVFSLGLPNALNYFLPRATTSEERRHFLSVYYTFSTVLCIAMGIVLVAIIPIIEAYYNNPLIHAFAYVLAILPWTKVVISGISNVLVAYGQTTKLTIVNIANAVLALSAVIVVKLFGWTFSEYMILYLCAETIITIWVYIIVYRIEGHLTVSFNLSAAKQILLYSIPIGLATIAGTINVELDKLMIGYFFDTESVAIYTNAGKELPLTLVATSLTAVLLPQMVRKIKAGAHKVAVALWGASVQLSYIFIAFFVTACFVFAPQVITILYSGKYLPGVQVFRIYSLVLLLRTTYFGIVLSAAGKTKSVFICSVLSLGLNVVLNYVLYGTMGFVGPALASFLSILFVDTLQLVMSVRITGVKWKSFFPWMSLLKITLINVLWGAVAYGIIAFFKLSTDMMSIAICVGLGLAITIVYGIAIKKQVLYLWRILNRGE